MVGISDKKRGLMTKYFLLLSVNHYIYTKLFDPFFSPTVRVCGHPILASNQGLKPFKTLQTHVTLWLFHLFIQRFAFSCFTCHNIWLLRSALELLIKRIVMCHNLLVPFRIIVLTTLWIFWVLRKKYSLRYLYNFKLCNKLELKCFLRKSMWSLR